MLISIIVALARNRVIGTHGRMPWHLPTDLKRFKTLTMGHTLLMGWQTFESIGQPLPGRRTIILSRNLNYQIPGVEVVADLPAALQAAKGSDELFICGGGEIYRQTLYLAQRIYLTELELEFAGDVYFPKLPVGSFHILKSEQVEDKVNYQFSVLERIDTASDEG
jgi:dihydrofolate reductase